MSTLTLSLYPIGQHIYHCCVYGCCCCWPYLASWPRLEVICLEAPSTRPCWVSLSGFVWTNLGHKAPILCSSLEILLQSSRHDALRQQCLWEHGVGCGGAMRCFLDFNDMIHVYFSYVSELAFVPWYCKRIVKGGRVMSCCENSERANPKPSTN